MTETWFHIDMDAFFASIEQHDHPEYRGKPVIVGAMPGHRGVVSTCSYEARRFGVHSAMPINEAYQRCPDGIYVIPRMHRYQEISAAIMQIFNRHSPRLIQVSVDEAFLDMTGTLRLLGTPESIARVIKEQVATEIGLTLSIGIAANKLIAKIASGKAKPDGLTIVQAGQEADFIRSLPLDKIWGLGTKTRQNLQALRITNVDQLRAMPLPELRGHFGSSGGEFLYQVCRGIDPGLYEGDSRQHSISSETTFENDISDRDILEKTLFDLCNHNMFRLNTENSHSQVLFVKIRLHDFSTSSMQKKIGHPVQSIEECFAVARQLFRSKWDGHTPVRLLGTGFDQVSTEPDSQLQLFADPEQKRAQIEKAVQDLRMKFKFDVIKKGSLINPVPDATSKKKST